MRRVDNKSDRDVTDIFWKVAGFERDVVPKQDSICDATPLEGEEKPHPEGPLYYSTGPRFYDTTVYAPKGGFKGAGKISAAKSTPELDSVIGVANRYSGGKTDIGFRASVKPSGDKSEFEYEVTSSGPEKLLVYWYIPLTDDFKPLNISRSAPITPMPGQAVRRSVRSSDPVGWTAATVQIFDYDHRWLATGIASVYCSMKGKAETLLEQPGPKEK